MAYSGYLVKVGDYIIPYKYIKFNSYSVFMSTTDLDSYRDANGVLHRTALAHKPNKVEFETRAMLTNDEFSTLMRNIQENYTNVLEKKAVVTAYIPELDEYVTQNMYMPDVKVSINRHNNDLGKLQYNSIRLAFIGY